MAAYAALVSLLNNIHQIMNHPRLSTSLHNKHIQPLLQNTGFLLDYVEGNKYGGGSKEVADLERKIAYAAHAAEDVIEAQIVDRIHSGRYFLTFLLHCVGHICDRSERSLRQINEDMEAIIKEANEFKVKQRLGEKQQPTHVAVTLRDGGESGMVGLGAELNELLDELTRYQSSRRITSIIGMGGSGKTTLAKNVYENSLIKEHFQFRAWATISQQINAKEVFSKLLQLGDLSNATVDDLGKDLHQTLLVRRYLIVLDDIWSVKAWDEVKRFFPDNNKGSRVLLTTRLTNVAIGCGSSLFTLNLLDEESSWKLFCEKAFQNEDCPPELQEVSKEIVKFCKGLALSIIVIGGLLLKSPRTVGNWEGLAKDLKSIPNSKEKKESLDVLALSYNHLPPHLKPCFLYMGVFKEDSKIRVSRIIKLWVAEGFVKPIGSRVLEEIAKGYLKDLLDRNLILVGGHRKNGKVRFCGIHDLLRDLCIKIAEQEEFFHVRSHGIHGTERRLVYLYMESTGVRLPVIRSIILETCIDKPTEYKLLRVLDEDGYGSKMEYYENVNLRYLTYKHLSYVKSAPKLLPTSLSLMWCLQTLIIRNKGEPLLIVPTELWEMRSLRHVQCDQFYLPDPPRSNSQDGLLMLENMQTLKTIVNLRLSEEVYNIIPNIKKLHLLYDDKLHEYDDSLIGCVCNLDRLRKLESLKLGINFSAYKVLDRELSHKLITSLPRSLNKLSLSGCQLHWDDMTIIGSFPQLEVLNLDVFSVTRGTQWSPVDGQFLRLKFLEIRISNLVCWDADESHFPVLEKLILIYADELEEIPLGIGDVPTLQLIHVDHCSNSAAISAVRIKEDQLDNGSQLQVDVRVPKKHRASFKQMLETEGLKTDFIQLYYMP